MAGVSLVLIPMALVGLVRLTSVLAVRASDQGLALMVKTPVGVVSAGADSVEVDLAVAGEVPTWVVRGSSAATA
jgi:hypothetical protein